MGQVLQPATPGGEEPTDDRTWLGQFLPDDMLRQCERAAQVDPRSLPDCVAIVRAIATPLARLHALGVPEQRSLLEMNTSDLEKYQTQTDALRHVRELAAELAPYEETAYVEANKLLDRAKAARVFRDRESSQTFEDFSLQAYADAEKSAAALIGLEEQFASLPDAEDLPEGTERQLAENDRRLLEIMLEQARNQAVSTRSIASDLASISATWQESSDELTHLFDYGWRKLLLGESRGRRASRKRRERRRRLLRGIRIFIGIALSLAIGKVVEGLSESATTSVAIAVAVAVVLGLFERLLLEPWLERRWFAADTSYLDEEVVASMAFWVSMRNEQAVINSYAGPDVEPVILIPSPLRPTTS